MEKHRRRPYTHPYLEGGDFSLGQREEFLSGFVLLLRLDLHRMRLLLVLGVLFVLGKKGLRRRRRRRGGSGGRAVLLVHEAADEDDGRRRERQDADEGEGTHRGGRGGEKKARICVKGKVIPIKGRIVTAGGEKKARICARKDDTN